MARPIFTCCFLMLIAVALSAESAAFQAEITPSFPQTLKTALAEPDSLGELKAKTDANPGLLTQPSKQAKAQRALPFGLSVPDPNKRPVLDITPKSKVKVSHRVQTIQAPSTELQASHQPQNQFVPNEQVGMPQSTVAPTTPATSTTPATPVTFSPQTPIQSGNAAPQSTLPNYQQAAETELTRKRVLAQQQLQTNQELARQQYEAMQQATRQPQVNQAQASPQSVGYQGYQYQIPQVTTQPASVATQQPQFSQPQFSQPQFTQRQQFLQQQRELLKHQYKQHLQQHSTVPQQVTPPASNMQTTMPPAMQPANTQQQSSNRTVSPQFAQQNQTSESDTSEDADWFGTVMTLPNKPDVEAKIVVHPPKAAGDNQFSFVVQNIGKDDAKAFSVEFTTPRDVAVLKVFPFNATYNKRTVRVRFERLPAGATSPVHIKTTASMENEFVFDTKIMMEHQHQFKVGGTKAESLAKWNEQIRRAENSLPQVESEPTAFRQASDSRVLDNADAAQQSQPATNPTRPAEIILTASLTGTEELVQGQEYDFSISVTNPSESLATDVIVQLTLPEGLMVTNLDRQAWIDEKARTVSWKIPSIMPGAKQQLAYKIEAVNVDKQVQKVVIGMRNTYQGGIEMTSTVAPNSESSEARVPGSSSR